MTKALDVFLHGEVVGRLRQEDTGRLAFQYEAQWLRKPGAIALSISLPLREKAFDDRVTQPFFAGLLPDERARESLARHLGLSRRNAFALLAEVGGECAGAVSLMGPGQRPSPERDEGIVHLAPDTFAAHLRALPRRPLLAGGELRLSLAGAQDKMALIVRDGELFLPRGQAATTHIVKTGIDGFDDTVVNELFCLRLAARVGLNVPTVDIGTVEGLEYLLVERYDRRPAAAGAIDRLHQEDFCQALGVAPEMKYESEGGPSLVRCFELLSVCRRPAPARIALMRRVIFNFWVGNADAHGKNFALLYRQPKPDLAPVYDVLCTRAYADHTDRLAMKIGGKRRFGEVLERHWRRFADDVGFAWPGVRRIFIAKRSV
ncbi:MAG: type II toxin-antitoxin system HipA family toxin [Acidobacteriota bacterium]